jgi:ketosteroid isomerase-like protein
MRKEEAMRFVKGAIVIAIVCGRIVLGQTPPQKPDRVEQQILQVREEVWRAWFADDETTLRSLVSSDAVVISAGEKDWKDRDAVIREAREFHQAGGSLLQLNFSRTAVQRSRDSAFIYSDFVLEIGTKGKRTVTRGRATEVFILRGGKWMNTGWHTDQQ